MKKSKWFYVFVLLISVSMFWVIYSVITDESSISSKLDPIDAVYTGARNSMNYLTEVRSYPNEDIPDQGFVGAFDDMMIQKRKSTLNPIWETMGPVNIGGRTLALAIHPEDPDLLLQVQRVVVYGKAQQVELA